MGYFHWKHVAAVLYGVGVRLDKSPELLFTLRGVDHNELVAKAGRDLPLGRKNASSKRILAGANLAALFGLDMATSADVATDARPAKGKPKAKSKAAPAKKATAAAKAKTPARKARK